MAERDDWPRPVLLDVGHDPAEDLADAHGGGAREDVVGPEPPLPAPGSSPTAVVHESERKSLGLGLNYSGGSGPTLDATKSLNGTKMRSSTRFYATTVGAGQVPSQEPLPVGVPCYIMR